MKEKYEVPKLTVIHAEKVDTKEEVLEKEDKYPRKIFVCGRGGQL